MKKLIEKLKPFDPETGCINVIIETPKGSRVKYVYDQECGFFQISKALPEGMVFPFNFGFVPNTTAEDEDPIDVLILNEEPLISGCLVKAKPIAVIKAVQRDKKKRSLIRNDRIIAQAIPKESPPEFRELKLDKEIATQIGIFFTNYNKVYGKKFKVLGIAGPKKARELIKKAAD